MRTIFYLLVLCVFISCTKQTQQADLIVHNAKVYTVDDNFSSVEAFAIKDGKFIGVGTDAEIAKNFSSEKTINADGKPIYPGFIDAHCHFYGLGMNQQQADLVGTESYDEIIERLVAFQKEKNMSFLTGRGWDQNDWEVKKFPTKEKLDKAFPNTPVALRRVDGHALLVNQAAIDLSDLTAATKVTGGEVITEKGKMTGVLIDAAMGYINIPPPSRQAEIQGLLDAQKTCFDLGLTTVDDAGLGQDTIELIDSLQQTGDLKMRVYAMVSASQKNLDYYISKGKIKTDRLNVRSFKVYGDGALGSRGAAMKQSYTDRDNHFGALIFNPERYHEIALQIAASDYQMNTHAIGDSANAHVLRAYKTALKNEQNRRWRIEHAQIISPEDFTGFENVIPSIQPTHATSDMYWAEDRVGAERIKGGYAFKDLLKQHGKVALGTDFPVEYVSPFLTFYAATARQDVKGYPEGGYQMENALSREETLKGMTIWAAYSNFEEKEKGSIEIGKFADFIMLDQDIMEVELAKVPKTNVISTFVNGEQMK